MDSRLSHLPEKIIRVVSNLFAVFVRVQFPKVLELGLARQSGTMAFVSSGARRTAAVQKAKNVAAMDVDMCARTWEES